MNEYGEEQDGFELYTCWVDDECEPKKSSIVIELKNFSLHNGFELKDREYIVVKL